jgi:hypothetical protein
MTRGQQLTQHILSRTLEDANLLLLCQIDLVHAEAWCSMNSGGYTVARGFWAGVAEALFNPFSPLITR